MISAQKNKFVNKRDFSQKNISNFNKALNKYDWDQIYSNNYQNTFSNFQSVFSKCFMNNFPLTFNIRIGYHTSQVHYENQSNINIYLDTFMPKIQLMKINRNVELLITN